MEVVAQAFNPSAWGGAECVSEFKDNTDNPCLKKQKILWEFVYIYFMWKQNVTWNL